MSHRVYKRNNNYWIDFTDAGGRRHRNKIGPNKRIAQKVLNGYLGKVARRVHLGVIDDSAISFADFMKIWWERTEADRAPSTQERWREIVESKLKPFFGGALRAVNPARVMDFIAKRRAAGISAGTINLEVCIIKHAMKRAVAWQYLSSDPLKDRTGAYVEGLQPLKTPPGRTRYLVGDEPQNLLAMTAGDPYLHAFVLIALNTGMRRGEILSLTRGSIDWSNATASLAQTKNGEAPHVPLNPAAMEALRALPAPIDEAGRLFPFKGRQMTMRFARAAAQAGVTDFRLHDCRHTFASYHAMSGTATRGLQELLRHKTPAMTARYSHLSATYLRDAVERVSFEGGRRHEPGQGCARPSQPANH
jgi:integrase